MPKNMDRRNFLKTTYRAVLGAGGTALLGYYYLGKETVKNRATSIQKRDYSVPPVDALPDLSIVEGDDIEKMVDRGINLIGGIERFISKGDKVTIKPNIGWDRVPEQAANTNPDLVKKVVELCLNAGAEKVIVVDISCNDPVRCYQRSGIAAKALEAGAVVSIPKERNFRRLKINGSVLDEWPVYKDFIETDKVINIPIAKHHNLTGLTMGLKNWYGILGGRREALHQKIDESIADLASFIQPTLTILDAYRILLRNGPQGGSLDDVALKKTIAFSTDQVAIDAFGATLFGLKPESLGFLKVSYMRGIGEIDLTKIKIAREKI
ncbi:MAG: DUF362 domain-containing protein [Candidatus Schekmanbacteria bacterium]|nr:MAG: DUF362 domain-containing protein [Candidatus Schekmanbacteria bacterium]